MAKKKKEHVPGKMGSWKSFWYLLRHGKIAWWYVLLGEIVALGSSSIALQVTNYTGEVLAGDFSMPTLYGFVGLMVIYAICTGASNIVMMLAQTKSVRNLRTELWNKLVRLPASHPLAQKSDELLTTITADATTSMTYVLLCILSVPMCVYFIFMAAVQAAQMSTRFLIPIFCLVPLYVVYGIVLGKVNQKTNMRVQASIGVLTGFLSERLRNLDLIKAYNNQQTEEKLGMEAAGKLYKANCTITIINNISTFFVLAFTTVSTIMAVLFGSSMIKSGDLHPSEWASFFVLLPMVNNMIRGAVTMWVNAKGALGFTARIASVLEAPEENMSGDPVETVGDICLNNVSFSYGEKKAVDDVTITIPYGKKTAIVGLSGSGKTTLLNLIERFYIPQSGSITVAGKDIQTMALADYRSKIAYVQQDAGMFSGTVRDAVLYGTKRQVSDEEIFAALAKANVIADVHALPDGLDSKVALWGESFSGGQRQKLIVARELLRDAPVILLDEPTSSLDVNAVKSVYDAILKEFDGKTLVTVTHELSLIAGADQIIVMEGGKVVASGGHADLMKNCPLYCDLVTKQAYEEVYQA